ncbi:putative secretory pathway protein Sec39 [Lyophyllum shimeji]|uniref:Secretory pathway protein Sec39 n=1 Tax=Lyophyllum shimeji TaxID=47721 RepID=A0A9P3ULV1_LYOSH|nr:putative secretory pathway protein Sec39 [Lyophyllum shimeji]
MASNPYTYWTGLADHDLTVDNVTQTLGSVQDDLWVAAAAVDRVLDDVAVQRALLELGVARTQSAVERAKQASIVPSSLNNRGALDSGRPRSGQDANQIDELPHTLHTYFDTAPHDARLCYLRATLLQRLDRLNTFVDISTNTPAGPKDEVEDEMEEWEDDPWADGATTTSSSNAHEAKSSVQLPFSLSTFLVDDLLEISCQLASLQWFGALQKLLDRHGTDLWPFRLLILESIPEHVHPSDFRDILPGFDTLHNMEPTPTWTPWRPEEDWSETVQVQTALNCIQPVTSTTCKPSGPCRHSPRPTPLTAAELSTWYTLRVEDIIDTTGLIDVALATVQHGASQGIPGLDELGEELSLLARLVYDAPQGPDVADDWTLSRWSSMEPSAVVRAYLAHSTPASLPKDIARLVMPYLFVLESRAERAGNPDPELPTRLLYEYILSAPLEMAAAVFEASKPTLPPAQRLIRDDEDIARLALACLYGSDSLDEWSTMSRIFECLPAWNIPRDEDNDEDAADTTISSLGAFVTPTTARPRCSASDLLVFFKPLPQASLSRALDILDVHLESGEILARWSVPAPLRWFLQSSGNVNEQRAWANRMARRAGGSDDRLDTQEDWEWLLEDMLKLTGKGDTGLPGAFGLLTQDEVINLFLSGLLCSGKFDIARGLLRSSGQKVSIDPIQVEDICLQCSREFYDNAQSGNYKFGDMKLAYDCLDVPQPTDRIIREKEFIEATSRIVSFNVTSRPGIPISPIEIRLTNDRLSLISRVLSSNSDAYKHIEVILDLTRKLGFRDDVTAEVKTLAMLADTALQAEDFARAYELSERMVDTVVELRTASPTLLDSRVAEASEVCWVACFQLGRQPEFGDVEKKLSLLGRALELCPPEQLHDVLTSWRRLEKEDIEAREDRLSTNQNTIAASASIERTFIAPGNVAASLRARLQEFHVPSPPLLSTPDAAALASRTFQSVAANFPFSIGHRGRSQASDRDGGSSRTGSLLRGEGDDVSTQATRVLSKGIGWLIGAEDDM